MQLIIDVKDDAIDKILYFLEHCKEDVKILKKKEETEEEISNEALQELKRLSQTYKSGDRSEFAEYDV